MMHNSDDRPPLGTTMRIYRPAPNIFAFYDGRIAGKRAYSDSPNWLDDGAYELGVSTYAIVDGDEALVYDTHISPQHAEIVRATLHDAGARRFTVILSHWHADHVAGNAVFADCRILSQQLTRDMLRNKLSVLEKGTPPIDPLIMPSGIVGDGEVLKVGDLKVMVRHIDVHSRDGTILLLPDRGLLLAGDTLEDPITFVAEPDRLERHLAGLDRLASLAPQRILPNHGAEARIASGGYGPELIDATRRYIEQLLRCGLDPSLAALPLSAFIAEDLGGGAVEFFAPYETVHANNVAKVIAAGGAVSTALPNDAEMN